MPRPPKPFPPPRPSGKRLDADLMRYALLWPMGASYCDASWCAASPRRCPLPGELAFCVTVSQRGGALVAEYRSTVRPCRLMVRNARWHAMWRGPLPSGGRKGGDQSDGSIQPLDAPSARRTTRRTAAPRARQRPGSARTRRRTGPAGKAAVMKSSTDKRHPKHSHSCRRTAIELDRRCRPPAGPRAFLLAEVYSLRPHWSQSHS